MSSRPTLRPGGRSARVQAAVHRATQELIDEQGRAQLTVPAIAARAGVTPSTIYRRWGELNELLADVAVERMQPEGEPADTGSAAGDLLAWAELYADEMSSPIGLGMMRDVLASQGLGLPASGQTVPSRCAEFTASQVATILTRGAARGEVVPTVDAVMDGVVAPIIYRALFGPVPADAAQVQALVRACMAVVTGR